VLTIMLWVQWFMEFNAMSNILNSAQKKSHCADVFEFDRLWFPSYNSTIGILN
jgi:hypothetical protein